MFSKNKKVILLGLILLVIAGVIVVALKGFNVSLMIEQHEELSVKIDKEVEIEDIRNIVKDVFKNKKTVVREVDFFKDAVNVSVESVTDEEKTEFISKLNEKYAVELTEENLNISTVANVRIRDLIRPYVKPVVISIVIIFAYLILIFRKMNTVELVGKILVLIVLTELVLASIIAIVRIPVSPVIVYLMTVVGIVELLVYISKVSKNQNNM